jgi:poly-gamma-glutamate synthesis protein (capsule biosynthesis protein)
LYMKRLSIGIFVIIISIFTLIPGVVGYYPLQFEKHDDINSTPLRMIFVGDMMLSRNVGDTISREDPEFPFEYVHDTLQTADITMGNLESPVSSLNTTVCEKNNKRLCFKASPESLRGLTYAGFDIVTVANNHAVDYQPEVLNDTLSQLSAAGIKYTGVQEKEEDYFQKAVVFKDPRMNVAFLGFNDIRTIKNYSSYPKPWNTSEETMILAIREAHKQADIVVVNFHFGEEYNLTHSLRQEKLAHAAADAGADIIIGHHPHWLQDIEVYNGSIIDYSLGNFIFDQMGLHSREGAILSVEIDPKTKQIQKYSLDKVFISNDYQPRKGLIGMSILYYQKMVSWSFSKINLFTPKNT